MDIGILKWEGMALIFLLPWLSLLFKVVQPEERRIQR